MSNHLNEDCRKYLAETEKENQDCSTSMWGGHIKCNVPDGLHGDFSLLTVRSGLYEIQHGLEDNNSLNISGFISYPTSRGEISCAVLDEIRQ